MQKVISINLNGNAYQLEEAGYDALRAYLADAERALEGNPDRAEIMADLEQAIADKCRQFLGPHKSVVAAGEVEQIVKEMGPIDASGDGGAHQAGGAGTQEAPGTAAPKKLFRIPEGAMVGGVCTGLAAYFNVDIAIVRIAFALGAVLTQGIVIVAYIVMMFVVPEANTPEQRAAAGTAPFNAQDVVDRAKKEYAEGARRIRNQFRHQRWGTPAAPRLGVALLPVFNLVHLTLFFAAALVMISLVNTGELLGRELPDDMPVWAAALMLLAAYQILAAPLRAGARWSRAQPGWYAFWNGVTVLIGLAVVFWVASNHMYEIREFLQNVPHILRDFTYAIRDFFTKD